MIDKKCAKCVKLCKQGDSKSHKDLIGSLVKVHYCPNYSSKEHEEKDSDIPLNLVRMHSKQRLAHNHHSIHLRSKDL